ncbi:MaoC family dehydratase N-terminal domain-containing protein [Mesorhizobium sp. M0522]|uniref:FAS1-like dehydratase domain-containing protein n=1 Tax=Mesorhizobium sp. M0522 TaxID=2956958 RepID=UPI003334EC1B
MRRSGNRPQLFHLCLGLPTVPTSMLGPNGHPARGVLPSGATGRRMWAGGEFVFRDDFRIGGKVRRRSEITDVVKEGRTGTLCFVTVHHQFDVDDRHVMVAMEARAKW